MSRRSALDPNLARAPFENARPVGRLAALLWLFALVVSAAALWLVLTTRRDNAARQANLERMTAETVAAREEATKLRESLEGAHLAARNERTDYLNLRIAERTFSWNGLLDSLGEVLPRGVRLQNLAPQSFSSQRVGARRDVSSPATTVVAMKFSGVAEDAESLLAFVDRLYAHPAFADPNLARESAEKSREIEFNLSVGFLPGSAAAKAGTPAATLASGPAAGAPVSGGAGRIAAGRDGVEAGASSSPGMPGSAATSGAPSPGAAAVRAADAAAADAAAAGRGAGTRTFERPATDSAWGTTSGADVAGASPEETNGVDRRANPTTRDTSPSLRRDLAPPTGGTDTRSGPSTLRPSSRPIELPAPLKPFASGPLELR